MLQEPPIKPLASAETADIDIASMCA